MLSTSALPAYKFPEAFKEVIQMDKEKKKSKLTLEFEVCLITLILHLCFYANDKTSACYYLNVVVKRCTYMHITYYIKFWKRKDP
jgi:hypothetical protein